MTSEGMGYLFEELIKQFNEKQSRIWRALQF